MERIRQSRPDSGTLKTVKARFLHTQESQGQILAVIRQSRPDSGTHKTVKARFLHTQDSQGQILAHIRQSRPDSGTHKKAKARFWPWRSGQRPHNLLMCSLCARRDTVSAFLASFSRFFSVTRRSFTCVFTANLPTWTRPYRI